MSQYKITKKRLAEIIKEEYDAAMERTDEAHCGGDHAGNRDEKKPDKDGDGVPDWADKKEGEDDHADKKKVNKESLDSIRTLIQQELKNL
jgi:hypothetical protein